MGSCNKGRTITADTEMAEIRRASMRKRAEEIRGAVALQAAAVACEAIQVEHENLAW